MEFNFIVKKRMAELKIRPSKLARIVGYSAQHIGDLLAGNRRWNETTMAKVCKVLGIKVIYTIQDKGAPLDRTGSEG